MPLRITGGTMAKETYLQLPIPLRKRGSLSINASSVVSLVVAVCATCMRPTISIIMIELLYMG